jgi:hypothetical protein
MQARPPPQMSSKRRHKRTIVVNGTTYTWKYGDCIEIRQGRAIVLRRPVTEVLGITWEDLERARRKGYGYPLTPARVAALIREAIPASSAGLRREDVRGAARQDTSCSRCGRPEAPDCCATCVPRKIS